jgi:hypothetical protein
MREEEKPKKPQYGRDAPILAMSPHLGGDIRPPSAKG